MFEILVLIKNASQVFQGTGHYIALFFVAVIFMLVSEENQLNKYLLHFAIAALLITVAGILLYNVGFDNFSEIFFLIPILVLVVYAATQALFMQKSLNSFIIQILMYGFIILLAGSYNYKNGFFYRLSLKENNFKISEETLQISTILSANEYIKMIAPQEVSNEIREYNTSVSLLFGNNIYEDIYKDLAENGWCIESQVFWARQYNCNCIILNRKLDDQEYMAENGFFNVGETNNYIVYLAY